MKDSDMLSLIESRLANQADLSAIFSIVFACALNLKKRKLSDWSHYYTMDRLRKKLKKQVVYLYFIKGIPVGVVFLSPDNLYYYSVKDMNKFTEPNSSAYYISTLAVDPNYQHRGIASQIINFCEKTAKNNKIKYLRLDCISKDKLLVEFYKKRGFVVRAPMEKEPDYWLLEKRIG